MRESVRQAASIQNADLFCLAEEGQKIFNSGADYLHLDVTDGWAHMKHKDTQEEGDMFSW